MLVTTCSGFLVGSLFAAVLTVPIVPVHRIHPDSPTDERELALDRVMLRIERRSPELDHALASLDGAKLRPLFRHPPRGWRHPAAAYAAGLDEIYALRLAQPAADRTGITQLATQLAALPGVAWCETCPCGTPMSTIPDDPDFPNQWPLQPGQLDGPSAWDLIRESTKIVAVIDCGTDLNHPELQKSLWTNLGEIPGNGIDDDGNGFIDDLHGWDFLNDDATIEANIGHGTRVSGVIGAEADNGTEVAGVCWSVPLMQLEVWSTGPPTLTADNCAAAISYGADNGASVMQMAWGFTGSEPAVITAAVDYAIAADAVMVSIAGNDHSDTILYYPAARSDVLATIATDSVDARAPFSNWGAWTDLCAPGRDLPVVSFGTKPRISGGTSLASAHVAGAAALLREYAPTLDQEAIRLLLQGSAKDLGPPGFDPDYAWGRIDLAAALRLATTLTVDRTLATPGDDVVLTINVPEGPQLPHLIAIGRFGRVPGIPLSELDPTDARVVWTNEDDLLLPIALGYVPGGETICEGFIGTTDDAGVSHATLHMPRGPFFLDTDLDFCAVLLDPADLTKVLHITVTARVQVR